MSIWINGNTNTRTPLTRLMDEKAELQSLLDGLHETITREMKIAQQEWVARTGGDGQRAFYEGKIAAYRRMQSILEQP